ncbi:response regulator [Candidatus Nitrospira neomarina]|uniref:Response regulator n=1 Tax=Candidatus Nitrospira neomarina TaxID=3020899 RepID=A0AA96JUI0_9BACT|nr:response regulator [Candidatus Nitrospira neomarina]WNM60627.1 response regulator [Candidatus Nitrospira neomarina]
MTVSSQTFERVSGIDSVTILLIDDSPDNLMILGDVLEQMGYQVIGAEDGEQGLDLAQRIQPDLIFMDVKMPGLEGFQVCVRLRARENFRRTPIILMSAQSEITHRERAFAAGGSEFWPKPITPMKIRTELHRFLK